MYRTCLRTTLGLFGSFFLTSGCGSNDDGDDNTSPLDAAVDSESQSSDPNANDTSAETDGTSSETASDVEDTGSDTETAGTDPQGNCPPGYTQHTSVSGKVFCCPPTSPLFCDENDAGFTGGCWSKEMDCATIFQCGDDWWSCPAQSIPYCDAEGEMICQPCEDGWTKHETTSGRPICCPPDRPIFCDENDMGYGGGCWQARVDCSTITHCQGTWRACFEGMVPICPNDQFGCTTPDSGA